MRESCPIDGHFVHMVGVSSALYGVILVHLQPVGRKRLVVCQWANGSLFQLLRNCGRSDGIFINYSPTLNQYQVSDTV